MLSTTTIDIDQVVGSFQTVDQMETELQRLEGLISRVRARQVEILAAIDHLQVPAWDGCRSLKEWIAGRLDMQARNASDLAVLAKSGSVEVHDSLRAGVASKDRAAGTARLENAGASEKVMDHAAGVSVGQLGQLMARHRHMTPLDEAQAFRARRLWFQPNLGNTLATGSFAMTGADMEAVLTALDNRADDIIDPGDEHRPRLEQRRIDALVSLALDDVAPVATDKPAPRRLPAHIFIDATECQRTNGQAGATTRSGIKVGPNTLDEILCIGDTQTTLIDTDGLKIVPTDGDRLPHRTRDYVFFRDGGCQADGCTSRYRLEPHHITHQANGGDHNPEGLVLLCWFHHHVVVHQYGFRIDPESPPGRRRFLAPGVTRAPPNE
ncbi:MAG: hypothetical protein HKN91_13320 [Acidimicrobiia bacterium]|nr:hypothetical protein [Acidimicrobiia bacterium]